MELELAPHGQYLEICCRSTVSDQAKLHKQREEIVHSTISASGDAYCPLVIAGDRRVLGIFEKGVRPEIDLKMAIQASPYITTELFGQYIHEIFILSMKSNREMPGCQGKRVSCFWTMSRAIVPIN
jgi:hypothetical protein